MPEARALHCPAMLENEPEAIVHEAPALESDGVSAWRGR
jgi:hypothetical protein